MGLISPARYKLGVQEVLSPNTPDARQMGKPAMGADRRMPLKRKEWPRIRETREKSAKSRYMLDLRPHVYGKGSRLYFENLEDAKIKAKQLAIEHRNKGVEAIDFPTELRVEAAACHALLKPHGVSLRQAVDHYLAYLKDENHRNSSRRVRECIDDYLALREMQRKTGELADHTIREIRTRMKQFKAAWGEMPIMAITRPVVKEYFDNQQAVGMKPRSRMNIRANLTSFFNHCLERGWIDHSPCVRIKIKIPDHEVSILTSEQAKGLLKAASEDGHADKMVPYFAVCLFAGLRPNEAMQLDWSRIRFEDGRIEILAHTSKIRRRRWAKIEPNGLEWLRPYKKTSGLIVGGISSVTWKRHFNSIRVAAGLRHDPKIKSEGAPRRNGKIWGQDVMRHSFASYWLATHKNAPALAEIMGNIVPIIRKHYESTVLEGVAKAFWEILPR